MNNGNIVRFLQTAPETKCVPLLLDIAKGLNYLHTLRPSIIHGDIKGASKITHIFSKFFLTSLRRMGEHLGSLIVAI